MVTQAQIDSMVIYLIDRYGVDARSIARRKAAEAAAWQSLSAIRVWARIQDALDELMPERPPTVH